AGLVQQRRRAGPALSSAPSDYAFTRRDLALLAVLTFVWGINWPVMKIGITGFPPLAFRTLSMWLGLPVLWTVLRLRRTPLVIARRDWRQLGLLTVTNMVVWHVLVIVAVQALSSGRAAILGYHKPIFLPARGV